MKKLLITMPIMLSAAPALAASKNPFSPDFYSLSNTDFVVAIAFVLFLAVLAYFGVHKMIFGALDARAEGIKNDLNEAKALREEAQTLLASYERKQKEVQKISDEIVAAAKSEAAAAAEQAKVDIANSIARRMAAAEDKIASAQAAAVKDVRDEAVVVAIGAARDLIAKGLTASDGNSLIDDAISQVEAKLH